MIKRPKIYFQAINPPSPSRNPTIKETAPSTKQIDLNAIIDKIKDVKPNTKPCGIKGRDIT